VSKILIRMSRKKREAYRTPAFSFGLTPHCALHFDLFSAPTGAICRIASFRSRSRPRTRAGFYRQRSRLWSCLRLQRHEEPDKRRTAENGAGTFTASAPAL
jgi:hypothetical protein